MDAENMLLMQLKVANIIKDGDEMEFRTNDFIISINREDVLVYVPEGPSYIVHINIKTIIGVPVTSISMDEIYLTCLLDNLNYFITDPSHSDNIFGIECNNLQMDSVQIISRWLPMYDEYGALLSEEPKMNLSIVKYSNIYGNMIPVWNTDLTITQLKQFMFDLFFVGLIDANMSDQYKDMVDGFIMNILQ